MMPWVGLMLETMDIPEVGCKGQKTDWQLYLKLATRKKDEIMKRSVFYYYHGYGIIIFCSKE